MSRRLASSPLLTLACFAAFAGWQPRARYRLCADPTLEELRKVCLGLRRTHGGREERLLLHFNGHGVPRPSTNGELWVFNRSFTQYIPLSAYDLQSWLGTPCLLVLDCSNAGRIIESLGRMMEANAKATSAEGATNAASAVLGEDVIVLGSCDASAQLPTNPEMPADIFTSCLTTPLRMVLRFASRNVLLHLPGTCVTALSPVPPPTCQPSHPR